MRVAPRSVMRVVEVSSMIWSTVRAVDSTGADSDETLTTRISGVPSELS